MSIIKPIVTSITAPMGCNYSEIAQPSNDPVSEVAISALRQDSSPIKEMAALTMTPNPLMGNVEISSNLFAKTIQQEDSLNKEQINKPVEKSTPPPSYSFKTLPSEKSLSSYDIEGAHLDLNQMERQEILDSDIYKKFSKEDLYDKNKLFQFILLLNHRDGLIPIYLTGYSDRNEGKLGLLNLSECNCDYGRRLIKNGKQNVRMEMEKRILTQLNNRDKNKKQVYFEAGAGGGLQTWMILSQMVLMGFTKVDAYLADPNYENKTDKDKILGLQDFFKNFPGIEYTINYCLKMEDFAQKCAEENIRCDIALALDWEQPYPKPTESPEIPCKSDAFYYYTQSSPHWKITGTKTELKLLPRNNNKF